MNDILLKLQNLNFSPNEAKAYVALLQHYPVTGSQLSSFSGIPRSMIYQILSSLQLKGAVTEIPGKNTLYAPVDPEEFLQDINDSFTDAITFLKTSLSELKSPDEHTLFHNIKGNKNILKKCKAMLSKAKEAVFMSSSCPLPQLINEMKALHEKGIPIYIFSFHDLKMPYITLFHHGNPLDDHIIDRIMVSVDEKEALLAEFHKNAECYGVWSEHSTFVQVIGEHIRHDIYLIQLQKKFGKDVLKEILLGKDIKGF